MKVGDLIITKDHAWADDPFDHQYGLILEKNRETAYSVNRSWYVFFSVWMKTIIMWEHEMEVVSTCK